MSRKADKFLNPKRSMDDDVEETTRKVAQALVPPNFGPMRTSGLYMPGGFGDSISTASIKASGPIFKTSSSDHVYVWDLPAAPTLPQFHPLERTAVFIPRTTPSTVAARISKVLRDRSIEAHYDNEKAKVKCLSAEGVDFRVRLYTGRNHYSHGVIVEVQRRFGFSLVFHSDTQAILDASEGKPVAPSPILTSMDVLPEVSDDENDENDQQYDGDYSLPSAESSLDMVAKMLNLPGFDSQYLGLQTLSSLVNPEKLSLSTARAVSTNLLRSDSMVGLKIFGYIVSRPPQQQDGSAIMLRNMSLSILANAMRACGTVPEFLREPVRPVLLHDLKDAQAHPHTAWLAATCMEYFIRGDQHDAIELNNALEVAKEVGEARHVNLLAQANKCIAAIR
ncbi:hypothetical protein IV203_034963 [Nitzschia inconspicua]|uniref:Uncharacterized protein n=1 Tax=Nitzschia inconspicua TaxID=303405 RepID=A0A9K3LDM4_9STRA|nr:hypothetical protein IV203_034963 [Nitzschia inconspicua]